MLTDATQTSALPRRPSFLARFGRLAAPPRAADRAVPRVDARAVGIAVPVGLYLLAAAVLLVRLGSHPGFAYNWESYTAWGFLAYREGGRPLSDLWLLTDGLMTDSGETPWIVLPAWVAFETLGVGLRSLRLPLVLLGALSPPLLWWFGRRVAGPGPAALAAVLLALSPVYLLYGRTATNVGLSIMPALATAYALLRVLQAPPVPRVRWAWLAAFQLLLIADAYAYAVIRFYWPMALGLFAVEILWRRGERRWFAGALGVTLVVLPLFLMAVELAPAAGRPGGGLRNAVVGYYNARGETIASFDSPASYESFLAPTEEEAEQGRAPGEGLSEAELRTRLVRENTWDYVDLLLDRGTRPALTDYWNPHGRLYPGFLVPFFLVGVAVTAWGMRRRVEDRLLLGLFFGFGVPLLVTSQVHIGRLGYALPFLMLLVAVGFFWVLRSVGRLARVYARRLAAGNGVRGFLLRPGLLRAAGVLAVVLLVAATARSTWVDYRPAPGESREARVAAFIGARLPAALGAGGVGLVLGELEAARVDAPLELVNSAPLRLELDDRFRYVNLAALPVPDLAAPEGDRRPPLYVGGLLTLLADPAAIPNACGNLYLVAPPLEQQFLEVTNGGQPAGCAGPLRWELLPE